MAKFVYPATISYTVDQSSGESIYVVTILDVIGSMSQGSTPEEAFLRAKEALALYYTYHNGDIPLPSSLDQVQNRYPNKQIIFIDIDTDDYPQKSKTPVKKNLSIPEWLCKLAEKYDINFSATLKSALIQQLLQLDTLSEYERKMLK